MKRHAVWFASCLATRLLAQQPEIGPAPGKLVDVGGRKLHLLCSGSGKPTVVLEAGASSFAIDWTLVQREVAKTTRVCSYDRAGFGWSDSQTPTTRGSVQKDLHALLTAAGEPAPYVLVGASAGGLHVRFYQADYPAEVAGMVLVDPSSEERLFTYYKGQAVMIASLTAEQLATNFPTKAVPIPKRNPQTGPPFERLPADLYAVRIKLDERLIASAPDFAPPEAVAAGQEAERARLARLLELRSKQEHQLGDLPLVVLSRGEDSYPEPQATHGRLATLSTNSRHTVAANSGHEIHLFEPEVVVRAIADVVAASTTHSRLKPE